MNNNWVIQNLRQALSSWNEKYALIADLLLTSPQSFKGGAVYSVMQKVTDTLTGVGLGLTVLFFLTGLFKTMGSFAELKRPETAVKGLVRLAVAKGIVSRSSELLQAVFSIIQGCMTGIRNVTGFDFQSSMTLPDAIVEAVEDCTFLESIPLWAVSLIGSLMILVLSFVMLLTVYGRFFRLYLYGAIAPVALSSFAGEGSERIGLSFLKSYLGVCLEGAVIILSCVIFSSLTTASPTVNTSLAPSAMVWAYLAELIFNMLLLVATVKASDRVVRDMLGI